MARGTSVRRWLQPMGFAMILCGAPASFLVGHTILPTMAAKLVAVAFFAANNRWLRRWEGVVSTSAEGLRVDGELLVRAGIVKRAFISAEAGRFVVHLRTTFGR